MNDFTGFMRNIIILNGFSTIFPSGTIKNLNTSIHVF